MGNLGRHSIYCSIWQFDKCDCDCYEIYPEQQEEDEDNEQY